MSCCQLSNGSGRTQNLGRRGVIGRGDGFAIAEGMVIGWTGCHLWTTFRLAIVSGGNSLVLLVDGKTSGRKEIEFLSKQVWKRPLVRSVLDELNSAEEDVIYFAEGTLFGMDLRFLERDKALEATRWIMEYVIPSSDARDKASAVNKRIHPYNAVHVRRGDHQLRHAAPSLWLKKMKKAGFLENGVKNLYIASDERTKIGSNHLRKKDTERFLPKISMTFFSLKNSPQLRGRIFWVCSNKRF